MVVQLPVFLEANIYIIGQPVMDQWMDERITAHQAIQASGLRPFLPPGSLELTIPTVTFELWITIWPHSYFTKIDFPEIRGPIPFLFVAFTVWARYNLTRSPSPQKKKNDFSLYTSLKLAFSHLKMDFGWKVLLCFFLEGPFFRLFSRGVSLLSVSGSPRVFSSKNQQRFTPLSRAELENAESRQDAMDIFCGKTRREETKIKIVWQDQALGNKNCPSLKIVLWRNHLITWIMIIFHQPRFHWSTILEQKCHQWNYTYVQGGPLLVVVGGMTPINCIING